jgi:hypothetical protein
MKSYGKKQPYRVWFNFLKTCLEDKKLSEKIDKNFYKSWNLNLVKQLSFDQWYKTHWKLFQDKQKDIKIFGGKKDPNTIVVEIPINKSITEVQREIGRIIKNKVNKQTSTFKITSLKPITTTKHFDEFLMCWKIKRKYPKMKLELIWEKVNQEVNKRQSSKRMKTLLKKDKIRQRRLQGVGSGDETLKNKTVLISRNINKCQKILNNVCKGIFPGPYAEKH